MQAIDGKENASDWDDPYKFTLVAEGKSQEMVLEVDGTELHGNVVEIIGRTEPGAALIINGEQVADIQKDGELPAFHGADEPGQPDRGDYRAEPARGNRDQARSNRGNTVSVAGAARQCNHESPQEIAWAQFTGGKESRDQKRITACGRCSACFHPTWQLTWGRRIRWCLPAAKGSW